MSPLKEGTVVTIDSVKYGGVCQCGKEHAMATKLCVIESGALARFDDHLAQAGVSGARCVVYDTNTYQIPELIRPTAKQEVVLNAVGLHADENSTAELMARMEEGIEVLVAVGGGTVHDIVRYSAKQLGIPFVSVPTAASCDGFCSNVAAMTWHGYKLTMPCQAPELVVADLDVIVHAPWFLTASGFGDMVGKYVALADWRMSHAVTGEEVCPVIYGIMWDAVECIWKNAEALREGSAEAYEAVTYGLLMSGLAMQMIGTSRPASGGEHHISHFIEVEPDVLGVHSDALHGEKVGVGTVIASREYHRLAEIEDISSLVKPYEAVSEEYLLQVFGSRLYEACVKENSQDCLKKVTPEALVSAWPEMRAIIRDIPAAEDIYRMLTVLEAKKDLADIGVPNHRLPDIIANSPLIRNRLTLMRMRRMLCL